MAGSAGPEIERLISLLSRLPGLGPRSARRAALALLKRREQLMTPLAEAMAEAAARVRACSACGALDTRDPCTVCSDGSRDAGLICVVEEAGALWALERGGTFRGRYHVLGGLLSALDGVGPDDLRIAGLLARVAAGGVRESSSPCRPRSTARPPPTTWPISSPGAALRSPCWPGACPWAANSTGWTTAPWPRPCAPADPPDRAR